MAVLRRFYRVLAVVLFALGMFFNSAFSDESTYTISYETDGGTNYANAPASYVAGVGATIDGIPTKSNYIFGGWCTGRTLVGNLRNCAMTQTISTSATGNKTFYAKWLSPAFTLTISNANTFAFKISAAGTFYVDWGDGTVQEITRTSTTMETISHTYSSAYSGPVRFAGLATGYSDTQNCMAGCSAIRFNTFENEISEEVTALTNDVRKITGVSGSLGAIFPTLSNPTYGGGQPSFARTFSNATNWTGTLPSNLFNGISGAPRSWMFYKTFDNSGISGPLPALFSGLSGAPAQAVFRGTFDSCSNLTGLIPTGLFGNLSGTPAEDMFFQTFDYDSGLTGFTDGTNTTTYVPGDFLSDISTNTSVSYQVSNMFRGTQLASSCPANTYTVTRQQFNNAGKPWCSPCPSGKHYNGTGATSVNQCCDDNYDWDSTTSSCRGSIYTITYIDGQDTQLTGLTPTTYRYGEGAIINAVPTKTGYTFVEWCGTDTGEIGVLDCDMPQTISTTDAGNKVFYTRWTPIPYSITYTLNGGAHGTTHPDTHTIADSDITISNPTRTGYTFNGWTVTTAPTAWGTGSSTSGDQNFKIATGTYGNIALSANWTAKTYTITYNPGEGAGGISNTVATYDDNFIPATPNENTITKTNAVFTGWAVSGTDDIKSAEDAFVWKYTEDKTLTATWLCAAGNTLNTGTGVCEQCAVGTYKESIGNAACTVCAIGAYPNLTHTGCVACQNGFTTNTAGSTSCDAACQNIAHVNTWAVAEWTNNTVSNLCKIENCVSGYNVTSENGNGLYANICTAKTVALSYIDTLDNSTIETTPTMCTYDSPFNLPVAPTKQGYRFTGWELVQ